MKAATRVEQDRARAEADRVTTFARHDADRHLARRKLQLLQRLARLKLRQQYLGGNVTDRSAIPQHGGDDQLMQRDRHDYVEYELGAEY